MGKKVPLTRSRSNGSRLETGLVPRRRSRRLKKRNIQYKKQISHIPYKCHAARSLFTVKSISDLPNELTIKIFNYFNAKELLSLRNVNHHFKDLIDETRSIWSRVSYHNMWPTSHIEYMLFERGAQAGNIECLTKLGLSHLYHYNLTVGEEKNKKDVDFHSVKAAEYLHNLDVNLAPNKPLTWMLIRPPWSTSKSICLKHLVHTQMLAIKETHANGPVCYNIGKVLNLDESCENKDKINKNFLESFKHRCSHAQFELLSSKRKHTLNDAGKSLQWVRELKECAATGNKEACFLLVNYIVSSKAYKNDLLNTNEISRSLFQDCKCMRIDKLELYQPKINSLMRCILVDWLAEVAYMKDMSHQVLHAAVNYVDQYLILRVVERTKLQLLGITCLLLAAKSHYDARQVHILTVRESSWLTDQTYQYEDVVRMMGEIIGTFGGHLWKPTSWNFLNTLLTSPAIDNSWNSYCHYLHDLTLQFTVFGSYKPSVLACSTVLLAGILLDRDDPWSSELIDLTGNDIKDIANCASLIFYKCFTCPSMKDDRGLPLESIKALYRGERFHAVANIPPQDENTIKSRILAADSSLSCISTEPLQFDIVSTEVDETFNTSIKSVDYYGDSECEMDSDSDFDESFCVGRNRLSSYHSVEEFSDDETTMDANSLHFNNSDVLLPIKENFTPIFGSNSDKDKSVFFDGDVAKGAGFHGQYLQLDSYEVSTANGSSSNNNCSASSGCCGVVGMRTRSNAHM